jgi:NitT/TauT family transport system substrate-binding protein
MGEREVKKGVVTYSLLILALLMVFICSGCKEEDTLKIGLLPNEEVLPFYVAIEEGLYQKHGVDVEVVHFQSAAERDAALQAGAVDGVEGDLLAVPLLGFTNFLPCSKTSP